MSKFLLAKIDQRVRQTIHNSSHKKKKYMHIKLFALKQYVYSTYMYAFTFYLYLKLSIILSKIYGKDFKEEGMQINRII